MLKLSCICICNTLTPKPLMQTEGISDATKSAIRTLLDLAEAETYHEQNFPRITNVTDLFQHVSNIFRKNQDIKICFNTIAAYFGISIFAFPFHLGRASHGSDLESHPSHPSHPSLVPGLQHAKDHHGLESGARKLSLPKGSLVSIAFTSSTARGGGGSFKIGNL